jgi:hypothetical protein
VVALIVPEEGTAMAVQASVDRLKLLLAAGLWGCGLLAGGCPRGERAECPIPVARATPRDACPDWRWIGIMEGRGTACPRPRAPAWTTRPLFPTPDPRLATVPAGLRPYCLYEHPAAGGELTLDELPGLIAIERDCMAVLPAASSLPRAALAKLEPYFLQQAGGFAAPPPLVGAAPAVRLALLDTAPTSEAPAENADNRSLHGYSLARMATKLACGPGGCAARITSQLGLPWVVYEPSSRTLSVRDDLRGGFVGMIGELAEATRSEVVTWQAVDAPKPLVLNLSVGWNPAFGGGEATVAAMPPAVQAVHAAITDALCRGVSVVAAGGNRTWGPDPKFSRGPLLPAAWEQRAAPTDLECAAARSPGTPVDLGSTSYRPFVSAVGAVDASGRQLGNARLKAEPRLVAFGDHAAVSGETSAVPTAMLTGSSVSTVIAATALSWVRAYRPTLKVLDAVDLLHEGAQPTGRQADIHFRPKEGSVAPPDSAWAVGRVSVAKAAAAACAGQGISPCPGWTPPPTGPPNLGAGAYSDFAGATTVRLSQLAVLAPTPHDDCPPEAWRAALRAAGEQAEPERFHGSVAASVYRCPQWQLFDVSFHAMVGPQPESDPCPGCGFGPPPPGSVAMGGVPLAASPLLAVPAFAAPAADGTAYLEIDTGYTRQLSSPLLKVGNQTYALDAVWKDLRPGSKLVITDIPAGPNDTLQFSCVVNGVRSTTSLFLRTN